MLQPSPCPSPSFLAVTNYLPCCRLGWKETWGFESSAYEGNTLKISVISSEELKD
jgi:hypothetical protein